MYSTAQQQTFTNVHLKADMSHKPERDTRTLGRQHAFYAQDGRAPLHVAAMSGNMKAVERLLAAGARRAILDKVTSTSLSPHTHVHLPVSSSFIAWSADCSSASLHRACVP